MQSMEIAGQIAELRDRIRPLAKQLDALASQYRDARSREWIAANGVAADDVQTSRGDDLPFFGTIWAFAEWLKKTRCDKRWCEWNGRIYSTAEIIAGRRDQGAPGFVSHLTGAE
jgi:hypothetical protein